MSIQQIKIRPSYENPIIVKLSYSSGVTHRVSFAKVEDRDRTVSVNRIAPGSRMTPEEADGGLLSDAIETVTTYTTYEVIE